MEQLERAILLRRSGNPAEAIEILKELLKRAPTNAAAHYQMAWCHDVQGLEREAVPYYRAAIEFGLSDDDLADTSNDAEIARYKEAIRFYASRLDEVF